MSAHNIIVNDVQKSENKVLCLVRVDNYRNMLKHVSIGQSIRTEPIPINFSDSNGTSNSCISQYEIIYYPRGQYIQSRNSDVLESGQASVYLKMVHCENEDDPLAMNVKFFMKAPYFEMKDKFDVTKEVTFSYRNLDKRWIGPFNLVSTGDLYSSRCKNFFVNDSLTIGCELNVTMSRPYNTHIQPMKWTKENPDTVSRYSNLTWRQKLLQSCNRKTEDNFKSEESSKENVFPLSSRDAGYV